MEELIILHTITLHYVYIHELVCVRTKCVDLLLVRLQFSVFTAACTWWCENYLAITTGTHVKIPTKSGRYLRKYAISELIFP